MNCASSLRSHAVDHPEAAALTWSDSTWTYRQVDDQLSRISGGLKSLGVGSGDRVVVSLPNVPAFPLLVHATWRAGGVHVPVNPRASDAELEVVIRHAAPAVVVVSSERVATMLRLRGESETFAIVAWPEPRDGDASVEGLLAHAPDSSIAEVDEDDLAVIAFTSGTSGSSKGAMLSHGSSTTAMRMFAHLHRFGPDDRILQTLPCSSFNCLLSGVFLAWAVGGSSVLADFQGAKGFLDLVESHRPTFFGSVPTMHHDLLASGLVGDLSSVRFAIFGGAPSAPGLAEAMRQQFSLRLLHAYGLTEGPSVLACDPCTAPLRTSGVGLPLPHVAIEALDADGAPCPVGDVGELHVRARRTGPFAHTYRPFLGYWRRPDLTPAMVGAGVLPTGDLGYLDHTGAVHIVGRAKDVIIRGGNNIVAADLERLLTQDARVEEAYVVAVADERLGEVPTALVVLAPGATAHPEELLELVNAQVSPYKRLEGLRILEGHELPRNAMGKVVKREIAHPG